MSTQNKTNNNELSFEQRMNDVKKQISLSKQVRNIVAKNIMSDSFKQFRYSLISLVILPGLTNIYYTFRNHSPWKTIMMIGIPLGCIFNVLSTYQKGILKFSQENTDDAKQVRDKYIKHYFLKYGMAGQEFQSMIQSHIIKGFKYEIDNQKKE